MTITQTTATSKRREADCFVVDYDRLLPTGWPRLTPADQYEPARTNRNAANFVDRIRTLELLTAGLSTRQVADRMGCCRDAIYKIRARARAGLA